MKRVLVFVALITFVASQHRLRNVFVDIEPGTESYTRMTMDAEKTVNMIRNRTSYPHRRVTGTRYVRHKSMIDTGISEIGVTVAQTNCTIPDRFQYREHVEDYSSCVILQVGSKRQILEFIVLLSLIEGCTERIV